MAWRGSSETLALVVDDLDLAAAHSDDLGDEDLDLARGARAVAERVRRRDGVRLGEGKAETVR